MESLLFATRFGNGNTHDGLGMVGAVAELFPNGKGQGVEQDFKKARSLFQQACDDGDAGGCTNLGVLYRKGQGVDQESEKARSLYQQGCDGGNARGCTNLGVL